MRSLPDIIFSYIYKNSEMNNNANEADVKKPRRIISLICLIILFLFGFVSLFPYGHASAADLISLAFAFLNLFIIPVILIALSISWLKVDNKIYVISGFDYTLISSLYSFSIFA